MRECLDPSEFGSSSNTGWSAITGSTAFQTGTIATDINGNGGNYSLRTSTSTVTSRYRTFNRSGTQLRQFYIKAHVRIASGSSDAYFYWGTSTTIYGTIRSLNGGNWQFQLGTITIKDNASDGPTVGDWVLFEAEVYLHNTNGFVRIKQDGVQIMDFSGDTYNGGYANWFEIGGASTVNVDNFGVNSVTMTYDGGTGSAPSTGQTVTDGTTGATATITNVLSGSDGTSGRLVLHDWDGTAFGDNNAVTTTTMTAVNHAPNSDVGLDANSYWMGNEYIATIVPIGNGSNSDFTGSDGNSTDNYQLVDEVPADTADYVYASASGDTDTYTMGFSSGLPASNEIDSITLVATRVVGRSAGTGLDDVEFVYRTSGGTEYTSEAYTLPVGSDSDVFHEWQEDPSDNSAFTHAKLTAAIEMGQKIV